MPKINYKLASQRMNTGSGPGGLSPNLLSGAASASTGSGPQINVNAANTRYSSLPVPKVTVDTSLSAAAQASQIITQAAFDFQEKEAKVKADTVLLDLQKKLQGITREYGALEGQAASEGYNQYAGGIKATIREQIANQEPKVRQKMTLQAKQLENSHLDAMAGHKTRQFKVWQATELENRQTSFINDVASFEDPKDVRGAIDAFNANLVDEYGETFENRSEYTKKYQEAFKNQAYDSIISTHINTEAFEKAEGLIEEAIKHGGDKELFTKKGDELESAIYSADLADARRKKAQDDAAKIEAQEHLDKVLMNARKMPRDQAEAFIYQNLNSPDDITTAFKTYNEMKKGLGSPDAAKAKAYDMRSQLGSQPNKVLDPNFIPELDWNFRQAYYHQLIADRGSNVGKLRADAEEFVASLVINEGDKQTYNPFGAREFDAAANATKLRLYNFVNAKIDAAVAKYESPEIAWQEAKAKILTDTKQFTYDQIEIQKNALKPLRFGGMYETGQSILEGGYDERATKTFLNRALIGSAENLLKSHNIDPEDLADTDGLLSVVNSIDDPDQLMDFIKDANMLLMQHRYFQQRIRNPKDEKDDSGGIDMSGFGEDL